MLRKKKRIEALEKRVADLEAKLDRIEKTSAIQFFRITKMKCDEYRKEMHGALESSNPVL